MTQTYSLFTSGTGGDTPATLVTHTNANGESLRSQFSGTSAPGNPVEGQVFFNTDEKKKYIYVLTSPTEGYWRPDDNVAVTSEVVTARGTTSTLNTRLSVALNDDGSLKESAPVTANKWIAETNAVIYVDSTSFTVDTDVSAIYVEDRAVKLIQDVNDVGYVLSSVYDSGTNSTTVSLKSGTLDGGFSTVEYSTLVKENQPYVNVDTSDKANVDLDNITSAGTSVITSLITSNITGKADNNLMNTNFITNGILSAPNGVANYSGLDFQLPAGTVLACPDGTNADGTRKSIVVTTASLLTTTTTAINGRPFRLFYNQFSNYLSIRQIDITYYYEQPTTPTGMSDGALWYNNSPSVNKCYMYEASTWNEHPFVIIADFSYTGGAISGFKAKYPVELLKVSDTDSLLDKIFIGKKYINNIVNLTVTTTVQAYTLPDNGYISTGTNNNTDLCYFSTSEQQAFSVIGVLPGTVARYTTPLLKKGTTVIFQAGATSLILSHARFFPAINS